MMSKPSMTSWADAATMSKAATRLDIADAAALGLTFALCSANAKHSFTQRVKNHGMLIATRGRRAGGSFTTGMTSSKDGVSPLVV